MNEFHDFLSEQYKNIRNMILSKSENKKIVSFDIYDTLITRSFVRPTDIFLCIEKTCEKPGFCNARVKAEAESRRKTSSEDVTLNQIYECIPKEYFNLKEKEIECEISFSFPIKPMVDILYELKNKGKIIVLISDMYLPEDILRRILSKCRIPFDSLFVSSSFGKTKHTGNLFSHIVMKMEACSNEMLHIGDNKRADYNMPKLHGIDSIHTKKPIDIYLQYNNWASRYLSKRKTPSASMIVALDMISSMNGMMNSGSEWYNIGFRFGGPLAYAYSVFVESSIRPESTPVFVSRDGYNLIRTRKILYPECNCGVYIHAQRVLSSSMTDIGIHFGEIHPPSKISRYYGYRKDIERIRHVLRFLSDVFPNVPSDDKNLVAFYNANIDRIDSERKRRKEEYEQYLRNTVGDAELDIVDCTTMRYTSQKFIENILGKKVHGIYLVSLAHDDSVDYSCFHDKSGIMMGWMGINIGEFLLCSPEPPISGWNGGPCFIEPPQCESDRMNNYGDVTDGECDYASMMKDIFTVLPRFDYPDVVEWAMAAIHDTESMAVLKNIKWASDPDHTAWCSMIPDLKSVPGIVKKEISDLISKLNGN